MTLPKRDEFGRFLKKKKSGPKNPTWEERQEFEKERSGQPAAPWSHVPQGW